MAGIVTSKEKLPELNFLESIFAPMQSNLIHCHSTPNLNDSSPDDEGQSKSLDSDISISGPKPLSTNMPVISIPHEVTERYSRVHSRRKWQNFPLNEQILDLMNETVIVIDHSFQNIFNNVKSVYERSPSTSIARILNTMIGSAPVTGVENYFNDLKQVFLTCDHAVASKVIEIYKWVSTKILSKRSAKAPSEKKIPTIRKMTRDILNYDQNGILKSPEANEGSFSDKFYEVSIPFEEVIEL